jgi:hypothetical protein
MTVAECANAYGLRYRPATYGDNIIRLSRRIYGDDSERCLKILMEVNRRVDWYHLTPGESVFYIDETLIGQIDCFIGDNEIKGRQ